MVHTGNMRTCMRKAGVELAARQGLALVLRLRLRLRLLVALRLRGRLRMLPRRHLLHVPLRQLRQRRLLLRLRTGQEPAQ